MRLYFKFKRVVLTISMSLFAFHAVAQGAVEKKDTEAVAATNTVPVQTNSSDNATSKPEGNKTLANKKMVQDATISLQTTITGNQEQPKVLYILPWQSPQTADVDFEPLDNQQKAVFNHVERDELRRELEVAGESK